MPKVTSGGHAGGGTLTHTSYRMIFGSLADLDGLAGLADLAALADLADLAGLPDLAALSE
jgi:hypothetical protein